MCVCVCERGAAGVFQHAGISIHRQRFPSVPELIFHHAYVCVCVCVSHHRERERETVCGDLPESQASFPVILLRFKYFTCLMHVIWLISAGNCPQSVSKEETALRRDRHRERERRKSVCEKNQDWARACVRYLYSFHVLHSTPDNSTFSSYFDICSSWVSVRLRGRAFIACSLSLSHLSVGWIIRRPGGPCAVRTGTRERGRLPVRLFPCTQFFFWPPHVCAFDWRPPAYPHTAG